MNKGSLYLVPTFLAETNGHKDFPPVNLERLLSIKYFIVEQLRTARRFLRKVGYDIPFEEVVFFELNKHTDLAETTNYLQVADQGNDVGLLSEAGVPCVADPGSVIVNLAHQKGLKVVPLSGPSSIFLALMASGFNGQAFRFLGYLPIDRKERERKIKEIEREANSNSETQIFIETPYRNNQLMESLLGVCHDNTQLCVASSLTHDSEEYIKTRTIASWKKKVPDLHKKPTVFLLL